MACHDACPDFRDWRAWHEAEQAHLRRMNGSASVYHENSADRHRRQDKRRPLPFAVK